MLGGNPPLAIQLTNALATPNDGCTVGVILDFTATILGLAAYCSGARFFIMEGVCLFGLAVAMRIVSIVLGWIGMRIHCRLPSSRRSFKIRRASCRGKSVD